MKNKQHAPESGTQLFRNGCRVFISPSSIVGTVLDFENSEYLVRFMNRRGILETKYFKAESLVEQISLPFDEGVPF